MKLLKQYVSITLGCALMALAFDWFYAPNELTLCGFTGIAQVINVFAPSLILRRGGELDLHRPHQRRLYLSADG